MKNLDPYEILEARGLRKTQNRLLILGVIIGSKEALSVDEIHSILLGQGESLDLSTVYRTVNRFYDENILARIDLKYEGIKRYKLRDKGHTHYFICRSCKGLMEISTCPIKKEDIEISGKEKVYITGHRLELYGYCSSCMEGISFGK